MRRRNKVAQENLVMKLTMLQHTGLILDFLLYHSTFFVIIFSALITYNTCGSALMSFILALV